MALETNLNQSPYFDDFVENKKYHRVLFRPGFGVQARELTQLQSILQNQIEKFANKVVYDGRVVSGVGLHTDTVDYVKLRDKDANNRVLLVTDFKNNDGTIANVSITGESSGVVAKLIDVAEGSELRHQIILPCLFSTSTPVQIILKNLLITMKQLLPDLNPTVLLWLPQTP